MGKTLDIKPCIGCNMCLYTAQSGMNLECAVNPECGREFENTVTPALTKKNVLVVGGGLAGMEAARTLHARGHEVSVYEKTDRLAGNLNGAGGHEFKHDVKRLSQWYQRQMKELDIPVTMNTELSAADIKAKGADAVILATGSVPVTITFPGSDSEKVVPCLEAIENEEKIGDKVVIVGGGQIGCEIAMDLASKGRQVTIVEALPAILRSSAILPFMNRMALVDILEHQGVEILSSARLESVDSDGANVRISVGADVGAVGAGADGDGDGDGDGGAGGAGDGGADGELLHLTCDTVILSVGFKSKPSLAAELAGQGIEYYEVGDGVAVGDVRTTIHSAFEVARRV